METKTHWRKLENPEYLGSWDLDGKDKTVKILNVITKEILGVDGKKLKTILVLENSKPMIVNVVNRLMIQNIYNEFVEDWKGKLITIYPTKTKVKGDFMDCIRIRKVTPKSTDPSKTKKAVINDERLQQAFEKIESGEFTKEQLLTKFDLTEPQKTLLDERFKD